MSTLVNGIPRASAAASLSLTASVIGLLSRKLPVRLATDAALPAYTRVGNTYTADANGAAANVDGVAPALGDRVLLKNGAAGADNGILFFSDLGSAGTPFVLQRASDADGSADLPSGTSVAVTEGVNNVDRTFYLQTPNPIVLNTTALTWGETSPDVAADALNDAGSLDVLPASRVAKGEWDHGAGLTAAGSPYLFGPTLPDNAVVIRSHYEVLLTFTSATDAADVGLGIDADASEEIVAAVPINDVGNPWDAGHQDGLQDGTAANFTTKLTAARRLEGTVATEDTTAGRLILYAEYVVGG